MRKFEVAKILILVVRLFVFKLKQKSPTEAGLKTFVYGM